MCHNAIIDFFVYKQTGLNNYSTLFLININFVINVSKMLVSGFIVLLNSSVNVKCIEISLKH